MRVNGEGILGTAAAGGGDDGPRDGGGGGAGGKSLLVGTGSADGMVRAYDVNLAGGSEATSLGTRELGGGAPVDVTVHPSSTPDAVRIGRCNSGRYLQCERLWEFVLRAWEEYPLDRIARAFVLRLPRPSRRRHLQLRRRGRVRSGKELAEFRGEEGLPCIDFTATSTRGTREPST